ncbi:glycosyltransferase family 2 protein [Streptococcus anginosus]|uniref:glycosyltransferase family 2 protein n=1 Tax=Streptococcus anginosus TaxID=1328 RepID=UPI0022DFEF12|nr:glycosyltransferase [Streptococcus anginosus]
MPKVSVICTNYNKGKWIADAIDSFLRQKTSFEFEIILVDDCSTDESIDIIRNYGQRYPDKIRTFFNSENQGIAKTWVAICKEARGQYIARCDGDDYWIDDEKLQKQVDLLETTPNSKWSNTEFDMVDSFGRTTQADVFKNQVIPLLTSYEEMLVLKGMTMASTWLVDTELMHEVNDLIDINTADDTFNIQLELFRRTTLSFLPDSTTVYRMDPESDSRTQDDARLQRRFERLLQTQLEYLEKYPCDYQRALELLLKQDNRFEIALSQKSNLVSQVDKQYVTIYFSGDDEEFSQERVLEIPMKYQDSFSFDLPEDTARLRIDLSEIESFYKRVSLVANDYQTEILPSLTNGKLVGDYVFFNQPDPQLIYDISKIEKKDFTLNYSMFNVDNITSNDFVAKLLAKDLFKVSQELKELSSYKVQFEIASQERLHYKQALEEMVVRYNLVTHSRRWMIPTKIINFFRRRK